MEFDNKLKKQIRELVGMGYIAPEDIPSIELYMDQVTTFMDKYLNVHKRTDEDKTLTKTMINNYTKNDLLPPPNKKRYSKEHIILLIFIFYFKSVISINDIHTILKPLVDSYDEETGSKDLDEIYSKICNLEKHHYFDIENSIIKTMELAKKNLEKDDDDYTEKLTFLSLLGYDIFIKKKLMERIIDDMNQEQLEKEEGKKENKKDNKRENKKDNKK